MDRVDSVLARVRGALLASRGLTWAVRGLAAAAIAGTLLEVLFRFQPIDPAWPPLLACLAFGAVVGAGGWARAWPGRAEVARLADLRLNGRERLSTAVEYAAFDGTLVLRQRADAAAWAATVDVRGATDPGWPVRSAAMGLLAGLALLALALWPNPALEHLRSERAGQAAQDHAAAVVGKLAQQAAAGSPGRDDAGQSQALVKELQKAQQAVKNAPDPQSAVAALSQAQSAVRSLQDANTTARSQAAAAAGQALQSNPASAKAGQALASGDATKSAQQLNQLASSVSQLTPAEQEQLASSLSQAAQASQAGNPQLASSLQQASDALQKGDTAAAQQALQQAAQAEQLQAQSESHNGDIAQAVNGLQQAKGQLAQQAQSQPGSGQGSSPANQPGAPGQPGSSGQPGQGAGSAPGAQGTGAGSGTGNGTGNGTSGSGSGNGSGSGTGSTPGAAQATDKVYVQGQSTGNGTPTGTTNGDSTGTQNDLVPYTQVLSEYQQAAQGEVDRELIPQDEQDLVQQYFQSLNS